MKVAVGIKALNEEKHIADCIRSSLEALRTFDGEVILADSGSSDRTISIAQEFPIRIVQLANPSERCCGAGAQLAYQHTQADYFYLLDGDMTLHPDFLKVGVAYLESHPEIAAVGGRVTERHTEAAEFQIRAVNLDREDHWKAGIVDRLDCGGLYRVAAIKQVDYFADSNLHAFEEFELAARLRSLDWKLARIDEPAVDHFGHTRRSYDLLWRRVTSGYMGGAGEVLRGALGARHLSIVMRRLAHVRFGLIVLAWWGLLAMTAVFSPLFCIPVLFAPIAYLCWRRGSFNLGIFSFASWNACAWGMLTGFFSIRRNPRKPLASVELKGAAH
jgi:glycosyltransferase involved in cell wall biosynthesis